jgi:NhaC family Na+:H+ antiporter
MFVFQPMVVQSLAGTATPDMLDNVSVSMTVLLTDTSLTTGSDLLDALISTGGVEGMMPTVILVSCAMVFGGMMIGSGMLGSITQSMRRRIRSPRATVTATVGSGLALNSFTGDQYLSIIISANIFRPMYDSNKLEHRLLSRTVEDSVSVTSVLIPWNSCGVTQATVLGVATLTYLPYCIFNIVSPVMSLAMAWAGIKIRRTH